jgi:uncharacterized membrane protein YbhN (UPF0104 family)
MAIMAASVAVVVGAIVTDDEGLELLRSVGPGIVATLIVLHALALVTVAYRHKLTVDRAAGTELPMGAWVRLFIVGRFLNSLLPQAGTAYRGARLKEEYGIAVTKYLSGFLAFSWLSTLLNLAVAIVLILTYEPSLEVGPIPAWLVAVGLFAVAALTPPALLWMVRRLRIEKGFWGWAQRRTADMVSGAVRVVTARSTLVRFAATGLIGLTTTTALYTIAFRSLDLNVSISTVVLFYAVIQLGTYVSITPGNIGVLELASGALASQLGIGLTGGLLVSTVVRLSGYASLLIAGVSVGGLQALRGTRESRASD